MARSPARRGQRMVAENMRRLRTVVSVLTYPLGEEAGSQNMRRQDRILRPTRETKM